MKLFNIIGVIGLALVISTLKAPEPIAVVVTCKTTQPGAKRPDYIALADNCGQNKLACDGYKNDPFYGPSTPVSCEPYTNVTQLQGLLKKEFKLKKRRFPGPEGSVTLCKTRLEGKTYAVPGSGCTADEQRKSCDQMVKDISDPIGCKMYSSSDWVDAEAAKYPLTSGIECQITGSAVPYRIVVPDCSPTLKKALCDPASGKLLGCKLWSDPAALKQWGEAIPMKGFVSCRLNDMPIKTVNHIPARDCSPGAQKDACSTWGTSVGCQEKDIEKMRQDMLKKQEQSQS